MLSSALFVLLLAAHASAEPVRIRMAAAAPEGTSWAREFHTLDREVQEATGGQVQLKWYLGGIAGDEIASLERVRRGQLDGMAGALFCDRVAPTIRVGRVIGLFQSRDEWQYVMSRLLPDINREFARAGFANLGISSFGNTMFFTRHPLRTIEDLKRTRLWIYDLDDVATAMLRAMGLDVRPLPLDQGLSSYDSGLVDGFVVTPIAALAFQWSARVRYFSDLVVGELPGCFIITERALDALSLEHRRAVTGAVAKFVGRFRELGPMQDDALLNGLFERQGLLRWPADAALRSQFLAASRAAREHLPSAVVPKELLERALTLLADYRSEHEKH
jgi:TRAP-type C4-dicarboxylate transport system substrate-binding protein